MRPQKGFSLLELMTALVIVSIIMLVARSSYTSYVQKGRRIDAINSILSISLAEERYRSTNSQYGSLTDVWNNVSTTAEGYYTLAITNISATSYTITATAQITRQMIVKMVLPVLPYLWQSAWVQ